MKVAIIISRVLLGLGFIVFGLNIMFPFMPAPPPQEGSLTAQFIGVMMPTHWMMLVGALQFLGGLLVIYGRTAPLGLIILGPILVNIVAFHAFLQGGEGIVPGLVFSALEIFLIYAYWSYFQPLFTTKAAPRSHH
jgi:putative oxidoreductase